eukprot:comp22153_c0_seq2/m.51930 comp22153_c0_seq2/g.51930  ORF comp22153_c0_seq2/g.51930 comp22153_c0_seq2/m.51930 type:complete len:401 (+) comp22153_c0_seq2:2102-3304(+)
MIDGLAVQVGDLGARELFELSDTGDADDLFAVVGDPERERGSPEAVAGDGPVASVAEPVCKALLLDKVRDPVGLQVVLDELFLDCLDLDEPGRHGLVDEREITAPAVADRVGDFGAADEATLGLELCNDVVVGFLDVAANKVWDFGGESAVSIDGADEMTALFDDAVCHADAIIVLTKGRGLMDDSGTAVVSDVCVADDAESALSALGLKVVEWRGVFQSLEFCALVLLDDLVVLVLGVEERQAVLPHDPALLLAVFLDLDICEVWIHTCGQVRRQSPRGCCPDQNGSFRFTNKREVDNDRRIRHVLVVLVCLKVTQWGSATKGIWHDLETMIHKTFLIQLSKHPPHTFHKRRIQCLIVIIKVNPPSKSGHNLPPFPRISHHNRPTLRIILINSHLQNFS